MPIRAELKIPIVNRNTCPTCGCVFCYTMKAPLFGVGMSRETAVAQLQSTIPYQLERLRKAPDSLMEKHPCPDCGLFPPQMALSSPLIHAGMAAAALIITACMAGLASTPGPQRSTTFPGMAWVGVALFAAMAAVHVGTALYNPNRDSRANRARAAKELAAGVMHVVSPGKPPPPSGKPGRLPATEVTALMLVLVAPLTFFSALSFRARGPAVPDNPQLTPAVVSPGDEFACRMTDTRVEGIGKWRGQPTVQVINAKEVGIQALQARGSDEKWGDEIHVQIPKGSRLKNEPIQPLIQVALPNNADLGGKELRLQVSMNMTYAILHSDQSFVDKTSAVSSSLSVRVAPAGYTQGMYQAFMVGLAGGVLALIGGVWLAVLAVSSWKTNKSELLLPDPAAVAIP
jgi:hypothetical protein